MSTNPLRTIIQQQAYQLVFGQVVGVFVLASVALILYGTKSGYSVLSGGFAYVLPNLLVVMRALRFAGAKEMSQFISALFVFEMFKLILSSFLFLLVVKHLPVSLLSVLVGFIGAIVSFWIVSMCRFSKNTVVQAG